jgi:hypothetical protein
MSEGAEAFISECYVDGMAVGIGPRFKVSYEINGKEYVFTKDICDEIVASGLVKILQVTDKYASLVGKRTV